MKKNLIGFREKNNDRNPAQAGREPSSAKYSDVRWGRHLYYAQFSGRELRERVKCI